MKKSNLGKAATLLLLTGFVCVSLSASGSPLCADIHSSEKSSTESEVGTVDSQKVRASDFVLRDLGSLPRNVIQSAEIKLKSKVQLYRTIDTTAFSENIKVVGTKGILRFSDEVTGEVLLTMKIKNNERIEKVFENPLSPGGLVVLTTQLRPIGFASDQPYYVGLQAIVFDLTGEVRRYQIKDEGYVAYTKLSVSLSPAGEIVVSSNQKNVALTDQKKSLFQRLF